MRGHGLLAFRRPIMSQPQRIIWLQQGLIRCLVPPIRQPQIGQQGIAHADVVYLSRPIQAAFLLSMQHQAIGGERHIAPRQADDFAAAFACGEVKAQQGIVTHGTEVVAAGLGSHMLQQRFGVGVTQGTRTVTLLGLWRFGARQINRIDGDTLLKARLGHQPLIKTR